MALYILKDKVSTSGLGIPKHREPPPHARKPYHIGIPQ